MLARGGGRALTHRAVDAEAGLAAGSVSYYARSRQALVGIAVEALFAQDAAVAESALRRAVVPDAPATARRVAADLAEFVGVMTAPEHRYRVVARYELLAEAAREDGLAAQFRVQRNAFVEFARQVLARLGAPDDDTACDVLVTTLDGLLHRQVLAAAEPLPPRAVEEALRRALAAWS
ncbi:hypothetical protein BJP25_17475 [Actinokineospora bangkokensis]|uniref:Tetracyclin repressor-like C-terminal group 31 domain-containing protein n=1 Tax=Actinokineospora bangkokensis TaxID=1193682 RepID=A0A1Q9LMP1_9PSEU|nr:hypothetical protein BJP25_17475 [Actinokineospora bangkokensis]